VDVVEAQRYSKFEESDARGVGKSSRQGVAADRAEGFAAIPEEDQHDIGTGVRAVAGFDLYKRPDWPSTWTNQ
jgi:hypothetical protein